MDSIEISVVVPSFRRPALLKRLLQSLARQSLDKQHFEILIADDGPDQETRELASQFSQESNLTIHYFEVCATQGPAGARNLAWRQAKADLIAFTDDDTIVTRDWLATALEVFADTSLIAAWGQIKVPISSPPTDYEKNTARLSTSEFATANCLCRKQWLTRIGGFDERFTSAWREDSDLFFSLLKAIKEVDTGLKISFVPELIVYHPVRPANWGISLKEQVKAQFNALLYKKHPKEYRSRIQKYPPVHYYAIVAATFLGCLAMLSEKKMAAYCLLWIAASLCCRFFWLRSKETRKSFSHLSEMFVTSLAIPFLAVYWRIRGAMKFKVLFL